MIDIGIESTVLADILEGDKTIEGRLGKEKFLRLKPGDTLALREDLWENAAIKESIPGQGIIRIKQLFFFDSFQEMLESLDFQAVIPKAKTVDDAAAVYRQFYTPEDEKEFGVIAFSFELL